MLKRLIVNADDFGATPGINRGIIEAHRGGILTSASMMVDGVAAEQAAQFSREHPDLSVGLHVVLPNRTTAAAVRVELDRQLYRFQELTGARPTHLDSHHSVHLEEPILSEFLALANRDLLPVRARSRIRWISSFYGRWGGRPHLEQLYPERLAQILHSEVGAGLNELTCHPGYVDSYLHSSYSLERERELQTLCDPEISYALQRFEIQLATFRDLAEL